MHASGKFVSVFISYNIIYSHRVEYVFTRLESELDPLLSSQMNLTALRHINQNLLLTY